MSKTIYTSKNTANGREQRLVPVGDVLYVEHSCKYAVLVLRDGEQILATRTLKNLAEEFPEFTKINKHLMVRLPEVTTVFRKKSQCYLTLAGSDVELPVSRRSSTMVKRYMRGDL